MADINNDMRRHAADPHMGPGYGLVAPGRYFGFSIALRLPLPLRDWMRQSAAAIRATFHWELYRFLEGARRFSLCDGRARRATPALRAFGLVWLLLHPRSGGYIDGPAIQAI